MSFIVVCSSFGFYLFVFFSLFLVLYCDKNGGKTIQHNLCACLQVNFYIFRVCFVCTQEQWKKKRERKRKRKGEREKNDSLIYVTQLFRFVQQSLRLRSFRINFMDLSHTMKNENPDFSGSKGHSKWEMNVFNFPLQLVSFFLSTSHSLTQSLLRKIL